MRLLGNCPNCGADDSILTHENASDSKEWSKATCGQCGGTWEDWLNLTFSSERQNGKQLIPVLVEVRQWGAEVAWPQSRDLPCARLIVSVLNTALMVRFKLRVCFATEGGIEGRVEGEPIELRNSYNKIGLWDDHHFEENPVCQKILNWYAGVLRALLEEELAFGDKNFGRGAIVKLSPQDPLYEEKAKDLLWLALCKKTGSKGFADAVFEQMRIELAKPLSGPYVAGLTDEQIV